MGPHFFKCGKFAFHFARSECVNASMGPHFFKCGKSSAHRYFPAGNVRLQWGRTFSSAEREPVANLSSVTASCFNGAALFQVRKEMCQNNWQTSGTRFNGAALFQVRKVVHEYVMVWGRRRRFNGAALFQVRKEDGQSAGTTLFLMLQWGRTFSSAERANTARSLKWTSLLQWGRTFSSAERPDEPR